MDVTRRTVFDRETYVRANTACTHDWHGQRLGDPQVVVIGGTADDGWCEQFPDGTRRWRGDAVRELLEGEDADVVFVAGCEENQSVLHPRFDSIILLSASIATIVERVTTRTTNPYGTRAGDLQILKDAAEVEPLLRRVAHHKVVTTAPLADVVAEVLRIAAKL